MRPEKLAQDYAPRPGSRHTPFPKAIRSVLVMRALPRQTRYGDKEGIHITGLVSLSGDDGILI